MVTRDSFLVNWVKAAYSMEMGLVPMLEKQRTQVQGDPELRRSIDIHLQQTRQHVELLRGRLQMMGESPDGIQPATPIAAVYDRANGSGPDRTQHVELIDYVTESFESASYRALKGLAIELGDNETRRVCDEILKDEMAAAQALDRRLPGRNGSETAAGGSTGVQGVSESSTRAASQDNARTALANFDALNAHDLDRWERDLASDYRGEEPGMPGELDRDQIRARLHGYMTALPDMHWDIERTLTAGDRVVVDWACTGTHAGPMVAPDGRSIPPTGKATRLRGSTSFEFKDGKIRHTRVLFDTGDLMRQLGLLPGSAVKAAGAPDRARGPAEVPATDGSKELDQMAIYQTAHYRVKAQAVDRVKQAIVEFVRYVKANEPGTRMYVAWQQRDDPTRFVHLFTFEDAAAQTVHSESDAVRRFESIYSPELVEGDVVFTDYELVATNSQ